MVAFPSTVYGCHSRNLAQTCLVSVDIVMVSSHLVVMMKQLSILISMVFFRSFWWKTSNASTYHF